MDSILIVSLNNLVKYNSTNKITRDIFLAFLYTTITFSSGFNTSTPWIDEGRVRFCHVSMWEGLLSLFTLTPILMRKNGYLCE